MTNLEINLNYDATFKDALDVLQIDKPYEMLHAVFRFGYPQGTKATRKEMRVET